MEKKKKKPKQLERHFKGVANHRRIQILIHIAERPDVTLDEIVEAVKGNVKTISEHVRRLALAGLVDKTYSGRFVQHKLTPYGRIFSKFIDIFSNS